MNTSFKFTTKAMAILILLLFSLNACNKQEAEPAPDEDSSDFVLPYSLRKQTGVACVEKTLNVVTTWRPSVPIYAPSNTTLSVVEEAKKTNIVEFLTSLSLSVQQSLFSVISADAKIQAQTQAQASVSVSFQQTTSVSVNLKSGQQARAVLKGMYYRFTAEYYDPVFKKWRPITFDRLVKQGIVIEYRQN